MQKRVQCRLYVSGGFGKVVEAEWVLRVSRALAYRAGAAPSREARCVY